MLIYPSKIETEYGKDLIPKQNIYRSKKPWYYHHRCIDMIDLDKLTHNYIMDNKEEIISDGWIACTGIVMRLMCFVGKNRAMTSDMSMRQNKKNIEFLINYIQDKVHSFYVKERLPFPYTILFLKHRASHFIWRGTYSNPSYAITYDNKNDGRIAMRRAEKVTRHYLSTKIDKNSYSIPYYQFKDSDCIPKDNRFLIGVLYNQLICRFKVKPLTQIRYTVKGEDIKYHGASI